jgi:hypothetical protein
VPRSVVSRTSGDAIDQGDARLGFVAKGHFAAAVSVSSGATTMPSHVWPASKGFIHASPAAAGPIFLTGVRDFGLVDRTGSQNNTNRRSRKHGASAGGTRQRRLGAAGDFAFDLRPPTSCIRRFG